MNALNFLARRAAAATCVVLSACAAAPGSYGADTTGTAYGAFLAARYASAQSDPLTATHYYQTALQADPKNQALHNEGFIAAVLAGSPRAAALASQVSGNALAVMLLGNQAALRGDFASAQAYFATLPQDSISALLKPLLTAWTQAGAGNSQAALAGLTPYFLDPNFGAVFVLNAALIADADNDMKDASVFYGDLGSSQPSLRQAQMMASWEARQGQTAQAQAQLMQLVAAHPDLAIALPALRAHIADKTITSPTDGMAEAYLTIAGLLTAPQQELLKITFLRFAVTLRPDLSAARLLLANAQAGADQPPNQPVLPAQYEAGLATLQPVPPSDPLFGPVAMQEANLMAALNRTADAVALLDKVVQANPHDPDPLEAAGDLLRENSQFAEAIGYYNRALAVDGQPAPASAWTLYYSRAICEDQLNNWTAAEPDMQAALALSPNQPYVLNYLAYTWALKGEKLDKAAAMLQQATGLDPNDGAIIDSLGYVKLRQGQTAAAVSLLTQAVELLPDDPEVNAHLGDAFAQAKMGLQADYQWARALSLKPDPKLKADILGRMKAAQQGA
jgi:Flp pilus assembly protein TadD